jgi:hypothetical protein
VHPSVIGRRVEVVAGLDRVQAFCEGRLVADHQRCWARHQSIHDPTHVQAAHVLRSEHATRPRPTEPEVELRCLADYDTALGLDGLDDGQVA